MVLILALDLIRKCQLLFLNFKETILWDILILYNKFFYSSAFNIIHLKNAVASNSQRHQNRYIKRPSS